MSHKDTFTMMPAFIASDGNTILVRKERVLKYFQEDIEYKHLELTEEEKQEEFLMNELYDDIEVAINRIEGKFFDKADIKVKANRRDEIDIIVTIKK